MSSWSKSVLEGSQGLLGDRSEHSQSRGGTAVKNVEELRQEDQKTWTTETPGAV